MHMVDFMQHSVILQSPLCFAYPYGKPSFNVTTIFVEDVHRCQFLKQHHFSEHANRNIGLPSRPIDSNVFQVQITRMQLSYIQRYVIDSSGTPFHKRLLALPAERALGEFWPTVEPKIHTFAQVMF